MGVQIGNRVQCIRVLTTRSVCVEEYNWMSVKGSMGEWVGK